MIAMYLIYGTIFLVVGRELDRGTLAFNLFLALMILVFFLIVFSKGINQWLERLDD